jgi:DNA uptake protein ComE-like DNA-binding protein
MHLGLLAALLCAAPDPSLPRPDVGKGSVVEPAKPKKPAKPPMTGVLNVNRATEAELRLLHGIG